MKMQTLIDYKNSLVVLLNKFEAILSSPDVVLDMDLLSTVNDNECAADMDTNFAISALKALIGQISWFIKSGEEITKAAIADIEQDVQVLVTAVCSFIDAARSFPTLKVLLKRTSSSLSELFSFTKQLCVIIESAIDGDEFSFDLLRKEYAVA